MRISDWSSDVCSSDLGDGWVGMGFPTAAAKPEPSRTGPRPTRSGGRGVPSATYALQDRVEEPGWLRAQSGRFRAMASRLAIGRESCRESVCQYVELSVVDVSLKKKKPDANNNQ